jgi:aminoglycoside/choline kinase family phosphotransferase
MDAPPEYEDCKPFIHVARLFGAAGVNVPEVMAQDLAQGFLLLTDLGDTTYLAAMQRDLPRADALYRDALASLICIQAGTRPGELPPYDRALLLREMQLLPDWYIARHKQATLSDKQQAALNAAFETLIANNLAQPQVYVHRDYHSRNLMVGDPGKPGVLDFQDAVLGPITYDLVSLLKDAYIEWEEDQVLDWCVRYWEAARKVGLPVRTDFDAFYQDFEFMGLQRHLKVLGIFARLNYRDGKTNYLNDIPLVMRYTRRACERYDVFHPLLRLLDAVEQVDVKTGYTF